MLNEVNLKLLFSSQQAIGDNVIDIYFYWKRLHPSLCNIIGWITICGARTIQGVGTVFFPLLFYLLIWYYVE